MLWKNHLPDMTCRVPFSRDWRAHDILVDILKIGCPKDFLGLIWGQHLLTLRQKKQSQGTCVNVLSKGEASSRNIAQDPHAHAKPERQPKLPGKKESWAFPSLKGLKTTFSNIGEFKNPSNRTRSISKILQLALQDATGGQDLNQRTKKLVPKI